MQYHCINEEDASGLIHKQFPSWLKEYVNDEINGTPSPYVKALALGPNHKATPWHIYFVNGLCRTRHMPPGALAVNIYCLKHDTRKKSTTSSLRQRTQAPSPHQTTTTPPPPHTTTTPSMPLTTLTPPLPQTIEVASQP
ncbi:unnamed protein product [Vicia faba]|uniref:Uncharacterized protein n=1 Tax=Vicia faba TaxID=3906 RepID=A0AAV1B6X9_VICFA|nr:unnamed protein product [Vicia faba]